jgi:SAM-dependent methyltransferase
MQMSYLRVVLAACFAAFVLVVLVARSDQRTAPAVAPPASPPQNELVNRAFVPPAEQLPDLAVKAQLTPPPLGSPGARALNFAPSAAARRTAADEFGGADAIVLTRPDACAPVANARLAADGNGAIALPACPDGPFQLFTNDSRDTVLDRRTSWVLQKYELYAARCVRRDGIMWAQLTRAAHDRIATRVASVIGAARAAAEGTAFRLLDWGAGCGAGLRFFDAFFDAASSDAASRGAFTGLGIDLIEAAVAYARSAVALAAQREGRVRFCRADGTNLSFIGDAAFDAATAFGALLHVPKASMCATVSELVRVVRPGTGIVVAMYIDDAETATLLAACEVASCASDERVEVTVVRERVWLRGAGLPRANMRRSPRSVIWRRLRR